MPVSVPCERFAPAAGSCGAARAAEFAPRALVRAPRPTMRTKPRFLLLQMLPPAQIVS